MSPYSLGGGRQSCLLGCPRGQDTSRSPRPVQPFLLLGGASPGHWASSPAWGSFCPSQTSALALPGPWPMWAGPTRSDPTPFPRGCPAPSSGDFSSCLFPLGDPAPGVSGTFQVTVETRSGCASPGWGQGPGHAGRGAGTRSRRERGRGCTGKGSGARPAGRGAGARPGGGQELHQESGKGQAAPGGALGSHHSRRGAMGKPLAGLRSWAPSHKPKGRC